MKHLPLVLALLVTNFSAIADDLTQISLSDLREKYADEGTRYIDVDGAEIHYRDEGQGPVVLLLHASFFNLKTWDQLVDTLKVDHRVIRLDFPNVGLSGPETKEPPGGKFDLIGRNVELSSICSASNFLSLRFSSSSAFRRFASETSRPPYLERHL